MVKTYTISKGNASLEKNIISLSYEEFIDAYMFGTKNMKNIFPTDVVNNLFI